MALENLVGPDIFIDNLVRTNPAADDPVSQGDDHLRGIKNCLLNSFPNITGAVDLTQEDLNEIPATYAPLASPALTGTPTAPTAAAGTNTGQLATTAFVQSSQFGASQAWVNVTGSRAIGVTYTNDTGKPIHVVVGGASVGESGSIRLVTTGGVVVGQTSWAGVSFGNYPFSISVVIPAGGTYQVMGTGGINSWSELR